MPFERDSVSSAIEESLKCTRDLLDQVSPFLDRSESKIKAQTSIDSVRDRQSGRPLLISEETAFNAAQSLFRLTQDWTKEQNDYKQALKEMNERLHVLHEKSAQLLGWHHTEPLTLELLPDRFSNLGGIFKHFNEPDKMTEMFITGFQQWIPADDINNLYGLHQQYESAYEAKRIVDGFVERRRVALEAVLRQTAADMGLPPALVCVKVSENAKDGRQHRGGGAIVIATEELMNLNGAEAQSAFVSQRVKQLMQLKAQAHLVYEIFDSKEIQKCLDPFFVQKKADQLRAGWGIEPEVRRAIAREFLLKEVTSKVAELYAQRVDLKNHATAGFAESLLKSRNETAFPPVQGSKHWQEFASCFRTLNQRQSESPATEVMEKQLKTFLATAKSADGLAEYCRTGIDAGIGFDIAAQSIQSMLGYGQTMEESLKKLMDGRPIPEELLEGIRAAEASYEQGWDNSSNDLMQRIDRSLRTANLLRDVLLESAKKMVAEMRSLDTALVSSATLSKDYKILEAAIQAHKPIDARQYLELNQRAQPADTTEKIAAIEALALRVAFEEGKKHSARGQQCLDKYADRFFAHAQLVLSKALDSSPNGRSSQLSALLKDFSSSINELKEDPFIHRVEIISDPSLLSGGKLVFEHRSKQVVPLFRDKRSLFTRGDDGRIQAIPLEEVRVCMHLPSKSLDKAATKVPQARLAATDIMSTLYYNLHQIDQLRTRHQRAMTEGLDLGSDMITEQQLTDFVQRERTSSNTAADYLQFRLNGNSLDGKSNIKLAAYEIRPASQETKEAERIVSVLQPDGRLRLYILDKNSRVNELLPNDAEAMIKKAYESRLGILAKQLEAAESEPAKNKHAIEQLQKQKRMLQQEMEEYGTDATVRRTVNERLADRLNKVRKVNGSIVAALFIGTTALALTESDKP